MGIPSNISFKDDILVCPCPCTVMLVVFAGHGAIYREDVIVSKLYLKKRLLNS